MDLGWVLWLALVLLGVVAVALIVGLGLAFIEMLFDSWGHESLEYFDDDEIN